MAPQYQLMFHCYMAVACNKTELLKLRVKEIELIAISNFDHDDCRRPVLFYRDKDLFFVGLQLALLVFYRAGNKKRTHGPFFDGKAE
ncbi:hypothetical protein [Glaciecola sp. SC05]|uniref:hypothetical protein n=1 Tax=Glaciecola sp. SC05 TaxID=1987355 RepID=UPI003528715F